MTIGFSTQPPSPAALVGQPQRTQSPPAEISAWLQALESAQPGAGGAQSAPRIDGATATTNMAPVASTEAVSLTALNSGSNKPVPAIKLNPQLQGIAGQPADPTGRYSDQSLLNMKSLAQPEGFAQAFAQQFKVPGTQIGILGEGHTDEAWEILARTALATQRAVQPQGKSVVVAVETPTNPTVDAALDKLNSGKISGDQFTTIAAKSLYGNDPNREAKMKRDLQSFVVDGHNKGLKFVFWDKNRVQENGVVTVKGNRDQAGAAFLAEQAKKNPNAVYVVQAGASHAQVNSDLVPTSNEPGVQKGTTLANLLINKAGRSSVFSVTADQVTLTKNPTTGQYKASHQFPNDLANYRSDSPLKVPGVDANGKLTGAKFPTFDAIVPVVVKQSSEP